MAIEEFDEIDDIDFTPESQKKKAPEEQPTEQQPSEPPPEIERELDEEGNERRPSIDLGSQEMEQPPDLSRFEDRPPPPPPEAEEEVALSPDLVAAGEEAAQPPARPRARRFRFLQNETFRRVAVALPAIVFALVIIDVGGALFAAAMLALALLGLREYFAMTADSRPLPTAAYIAVGGMILAAYLGSSFNVLMALACGFPLMFIEAANRGNHRDVTFSLSITLLGLAWLGLGFSHAVLLEELPTHGHVLLLDVLIGTFVGDTCAYGAGRLFGKRIFGDRRLAAQISPNKTYEGLIGGFLGGTLAFWFAGLYQDWLPGIDALAMGAVIAALAPIGDLFASMIKRDWDIKDTGKLFGPHGGLIDRLDAAMFTIVAGFYLAVAFVY
jgi:phosphatidate cytidylyltransferase